MMLNDLIKEPAVRIFRVGEVVGRLDEADSGCIMKNKDAQSIVRDRTCKLRVCLTFETVGGMIFKSVF